MGSDLELSQHSWVEGQWEGVCSGLGHSSWSEMGLTLVYGFRGRGGKSGEAGLVQKK